MQVAIWTLAHCDKSGMVATERDFAHQDRQPYDSSRNGHDTGNYHY
jgi:hypothetical protein